MALLLFSFLYSLTLHISLHLSPSPGEVLKGKTSEESEKTKKQNIENMKDWRGCFFSFSSIRPGVPCMSFFFYNSSPFSAFCFFDLFIWACHMIPYFLFFLLFFLSRFLFPESFFSQVPCIVLPGHSEWVLVCLCMSYYSLIGNFNEHDLIFSYLPSKYSMDFVF